MKEKLKQGYKIKKMKMQNLTDLYFKYSPNFVNTLRPSAEKSVEDMKTLLAKEIYDPEKHGYITYNKKALDGNPSIVPRKLLICLMNTLNPEDEIDVLIPPPRTMTRQAVKNQKAAFDRYRRKKYGKGINSEISDKV